MMNPISSKILFPVLLLVLAACSKTPAPKQQGISVVTTTGMIADAVSNIAGPAVSVTALIGPGVDPHLYKASQGDLEKLLAADLVFYNGLHLEGKMGEVLSGLGKRKPTTAVGEAVPDSLLRTPPGFAGAHDPHIWFDIRRWTYAVRRTSDVLCAQYPDKAPIFRSNTEKYLQRLDSLDQAARQSLAVIPPGQRILVTAHDAFGYFGESYQVEVRGLQGISTLSEFGLRDVTELVDFIIRRKVRAIFVETSVSTRSIEAVREGCSRKGWKVDIGKPLYSDSMGPAGKPEGTYIGMFAANIKTITEALQPVNP